jgi:hypothetical protein
VLAISSKKLGAYVSKSFRSARKRVLAITSKKLRACDPLNIVARLSVLVKPNRGFPFN